MEDLRLERRITLRRPTATAAKPATRALIFAASARVAPIRFAMRVEAAMEMGKGILWSTVELLVLSFLRREDVEPWDMFREGVLPKHKSRSEKNENTYWNVRHVSVERTDWAARWLVSK